MRTLDNPALARLERQFMSSIIPDFDWQIVHDGRMSSTVHITCSVSQRSVLALRLFILHTAYSVANAEEHVLTMYAFADDMQLYHTLPSRRYDVNWQVTRISHFTHRPLDVRQSAETQYGQIELLGLGTIHVSLGSRGAAWCRHRRPE